MDALGECWWELERRVGLVGDEQSDEDETEHEREPREKCHTQTLAVIETITSGENELAHCSWRISKPHAARYADNKTVTTR
jgi:hypothetical protein